MAGWRARTAFPPSPRPRAGGRTAGRVRRLAWRWIHEEARAMNSLSRPNRLDPGVSRETAPSRPRRNRQGRRIRRQRAEPHAGAGLESCKAISLSESGNRTPPAGRVNQPPPETLSYSRFPCQREACKIRVSFHPIGPVSRTELRNGEILADRDVPCSSAMHYCEPGLLVASFADLDV